MTDVSQATTECEVIQILTNKFNAENDKGITVERLGGAEWGTYYDALNTTFAGGDPPDVAVMHGSNMPDYTVRNLLHITTNEGLDSGMMIRGAVSLVVLLLSLFLVKVLAERFRMPEVKPWGQWAIEEEA